jgi:hypothetical protein
MHTQIPNVILYRKTKSKSKIYIVNSQLNTQIQNATKPFFINYIVDSILKVKHSPVLRCWESVSG